MTRRGAVTALLVLGIVVLFVIPTLIAPGAEYTGTDNQAVTAIQEQDPGYRPWFESVLAPSSPSVESGLFAVQAALGGGLLGYVLGRYRGRRTAPRTTPDPGADPR